MTGFRFVAAAALAVGAALSAVPNAGAEPPAGPPADAMLLNVDEVRGIVGGNANLAPADPVNRPGGQHQYDAQYPAECYGLFNQDVAFQSGFTQFASVTYPGPASRAVTQAVAVYPNSRSARAALTALGKSLTACSNLGVADLSVTTQVLDQSTFAVCQAQCATLYRAAGPVLIGVDAARFGDSDRIATAVLQQITGRADAV